MSPLKVDIAITDCVNYGELSGSGEETDSYSTEKIGGIVGYLQISNSSYYYGNITIVECINKGDIISSGHAGGINGYSTISSNSTYKGRLYITNCYNEGDITSTGTKYFSYAGGINGYSSSTSSAIGPIVSGVYNIGTVSCGYEKGKPGGVSGNNHGTYTNSYYLDTAALNSTTKGTAVTIEQFNSGEVAYLLQEGQTATDENGEVIHIWGQYIDKEIYPVLNGKKVYKTTRCDNGEIAYSNTIDAKHLWNENGFCLCGAYEFADYNAEAEVYEIGNAGQLYWYAQQLNEQNAEIYVKLVNDIVIPENAPDWVPINASYAYFDGNFKTISGLKCIDGEADYVGLFGYEGWWYEISNLHIADSYFEGNSYVGSVVAYLRNGGSVTNCYVTNTTVVGETAVGTLVGFLNNGSIINCYVDTSTLIGENYYGTIENSYYLSDDETEEGGKTAEQFASGEVSYHLQSGNAEQVWGQDNNQTGAMPVFDTTGVYKAVKIGETGNYSVSNIGDTNADGIVDINDYQGLVNTILEDNHEQIETESYDDIIRYDLDGDGYLDVLDAHTMSLMVNGLTTVDIYSVGDFDKNGKAFEETDLEAIIHDAGTSENLSTAEKYSSDIDGDGKINKADLTMLNAVYGEISEVFYIWDESYKTCTANLICHFCNEKTATETVDTVSEILEEPTCTDEGKVKYTADFENSNLFESQIKAVALKAKGHSLTYTNNKNGTHIADCVNCDYEETQEHKYEIGTCACGDKIFIYDEMTNTIRVDKSEYIQDALNVAETVGTAENPVTIDLLTDIEITDTEDIYGLEIAAGDMELDLNGHTIKFTGKTALKIHSGAVVTVLDSGTSGSIQGEDEGIHNEGVLFVKDGNISGKIFGIYNPGTVNISGGTISSNHITICKGTVIVSGVPVLECYPEIAGPCHLYVDELVVACDMTDVIWNYWDYEVTLNYTLAEGGVASDSNFVFANEGFSLSSDLKLFERLN